MKNRKVISELMMVDVDIGLKRPANSSLKIQEKLLVVMGELYIGSILATLPPR